jgi:hypothetical protein
VRRRRKRWPGSDGGGSEREETIQDVDDGGGIEAARAAKEKSALQEANVELSVEAIAAGGALRGDQAEGFPGAQCG